MKGAGSIQMPTDRVGMESDKEDIAQPFGNNLEPRVQRAATDWFPKDQHLLLDDNMRLSQWLTVDVVDVFQRGFAYLTRIYNEIMNPHASGVVLICGHPPIMRGKACPDGAVNEQLDGGGGSGPSVG